MDNNININSEDIVTPEKLEQRVSNKLNILLIIIGIGLILNIIYTINLRNKINKIEQEYSYVSEQLTSMKGDISLLNLSQDTFNYLIRDVQLLRFGERLSDGGVVTEQFYVSKALFFDDFATVDIDTQPTIYNSYKGQGNFSIDDRELRKYLITIMERIETSYNENGLDIIKPFNNLKIYITIKNYDIATFENKVLTLSGE